MTEEIIEFLSVIAKVLEIIGVVILILGFIVATIQWFYASLFNRSTSAEASYRRVLGRVILIGLELLVAATIIRTISIKPTIEGMGMLVFMVVIRTTLGWAVFLDINRRWPWQSDIPLKIE